MLEGDPSIEVIGAASNGEDAVQQLASLECDVVVMDIGLPGISGIEATRRVKAATPHMNVLILSAFGESRLEDAISAGADGYMVKTAAPEELRNAVTQVSMGQSPIHPSLSRSLVKAVARMAEEREMAIAI